MMIKLYILVRKDTDASVGKLMAHAGHVCCELYNKYYSSSEIEAWFHTHYQTKIILGVKDEKELEKYWDRAEKAGAMAVAVEDVGFYQAEKGELFMIGILANEPQYIEIGLKKLRLFK